MRVFHEKPMLTINRATDASMIISITYQVKF